jgi:hypothetical protein
LVQGNGNSSSLIKYSYNDYSSHGNISYYRLQQFDFDGESEYSPIVKIEFENRLFNVNLYPNPAKDEVTINFEQKVGNATIHIVNVNGQTVKREDVEGGNSTQLDISDLSNGYYQIIIWAETEKGLVSSTSRLIKN